jgi:lipopolysaccharide transport protein LptA
MKITYVLCIISFIIVCTVCPGSLHAKAASPGPSGLETGKTTEIFSNGPIDIDNKTQTSTWSGGVKVTNGESTMTCESLKVQYSNTKGDKDAKDTEERQRDIEGFTATGDVHISGIDQEGNPFDMTSEKAVYTRSENRLVLTGDPIITRGKNRLEGGAITVTFTRDEATDRDEIQRVIVDPSPGKQTHATWDPEEEKK